MTNYKGRKARIGVRPWRHNDAWWFAEQMACLGRNIAMAGALKHSRNQGIEAGFFVGYDEAWGDSGEGHNGEYMRPEFTGKDYDEQVQCAWDGWWKP